MEIGIDGATWTNMRGYGRFTRELVMALLQLDSANTYSLFLDPFTPRAQLPAGLKIISVRTRQSPARAASAQGSRSAHDLLAFSRAMSAAPIDVLFFPSVYTYVPVWRTRHIVVGIHDVIPERYPHYTFNSRRARWFWNLKTRLAVRQAACILTVSEHSRRGIQTYFGVAPDKIRVTLEAPAQAFRPVPDRQAIRAAFCRVGLAPNARVIIYFGGLTPHKNVPLLVQVFARLIREPAFADVKLLLVGDHSNEVFYSTYPALRAQVEATCRESVIFTGYVDDHMAAHLLSGAQVCVLPSFDEGFGLPGIEAAACGCPLIATQSSGLPEVLDNAALYIDPNKPDELQSALETLLQDSNLRETLRKRALERARSMTWEATARRVLQMLNEFK